MKCDGGDHDLVEPVVRYTQGYMDRGKEHINRTAIWCDDCRQKFAVGHGEFDLQIGKSFTKLTAIDRCEWGVEAAS